MTGVVRIERGAHVRHRFEFFILDRNVLRRVFRDRAAGCDHGSDGFALPADAIDRDGDVEARISALSDARVRRPRA